MLSPVQKYCHSKYVFGRNLFVVKCKTSRIYLKYHRCIYIYITLMVSILALLICLLSLLELQYKI